MWPEALGTLGLATGGGIGLWALGLAAAATGQRRLIFKPPRRLRTLPPGPHDGSFAIERLSLPVAGGAVLEGWRSRPLQGSAVGTLLYFGGRGEHVAWAPQMSSYNAGWSVLALNHRGFGGSTGTASEATVMADARRIFDAFLAPQDGPVVLMGRSLGSAVALRLASQVRAQALVLLSPFPSLPRLARMHPLLAPAAPLLRHAMDSTPHAPGVGCRTLVLMARGDRRVPPRASREIARLIAGTVTLCQLDGQHHRSLPRCVPAQAVLADYLDSLLRATAAPPVIRATSATASIAGALAPSRSPTSSRRPTGAPRCEPSPSSCT
ncbi:Alpha/beta fold hydrolase [Rubrivivax sp. A210]|uniref:alpha/beta hydrolase n=1 Tax=Rubrivivax sp. A210 TaxID=2772301 RepID=UPI00191A3F50|nr:alpha/beta fold hydrolase [Rubrivivax sp. A210]CAD5371297.1 Alpha/beta fold hydrolase [Rubrivivax sp. A210]